jgi:poly(hydroxyalkanoate) depolymerase family esterase
MLTSLYRTNWRWTPSLEPYAKGLPAMALLHGHDGIFGHLMNFTPPLPGHGTPAEHSVALTETADFGANPGNLRMLAYVPAGLPAGAPLVVVLHGCGQTAAEYDAGAGWSTLAGRFGFALLLPEQRRANNAGGCFNWFQPEDITRGEGEAASIAAMVTAIISSHALDRRHVHVTGLSAGGAMTAVLLATYPDLFAGGAIIAGLPFGSAASMTEAFGVMGQGRVRSARELGDRVRAASEYRGIRPTVSIWQGTADTTVNPANAEELRKQWADVHGVTDAPPAQAQVDGATRRVWHSDDGRPVVETYVIAGLGHATPIDPDAADADARCGDARASRFILPAGISSTYRIAESWGLTAKRRAARPAAAAEAGRATPRAPVWQDFLPGVRETVAPLGDPGALIGKVLRSAGLMGGGKKD